MFWVPDEDHPPFGRIEVDSYLCIGCQKCTSKGPDGAFLDGCPWDALKWCRPKTGKQCTDQVAGRPRRRRPNGRNQTVEGSDLLCTTGEPSLTVGLLLGS